MSTPVVASDSLLAVAERASKVLMNTYAHQGVVLADGSGARVRDASGALLSELDGATAAGMIAAGVVRDGMIPKVRAAIRAVDAGGAAHIIDGRVPHSLLLELLTEHGVGTMCKPAAT